LGGAPYFVIEADEYDTAFFDKRAKFVHYRPRTAISTIGIRSRRHLSGRAAIRRQFNQLLRTVPAAGVIVQNGDDAELQATPCGGLLDAAGDVQPVARRRATGAPRAPISVGVGRVHDLRERHRVAEVKWTLLGEHNVMNALAAIARPTMWACRRRAALALREFRGVKRRMEVRGVGRRGHGVRRFRASPDGDRNHAQRIARARRQRAHHRRARTAFEHHEVGRASGELAPSLASGGSHLVLDRPDLGWDLPERWPCSLAPRVGFAAAWMRWSQKLADEAKPGDQVLVMSNGGFGGLHEKLLAELRSERLG
jgi:UDP-N-acetylmuramate: L-alanyl-gamma-D-glutamyl-meso-diaminopimelate ligase